MKILRNKQSSTSKTDSQFENVADLTPEQRALLMLRLRKKGSRRTDEKSQAPLIQPTSREGHLPLSFAQQRLWFLDQLVPNSPLYNVPVAARLKGQLHVAALEQSLNEIIRRHEVLRTTFTSVEDQPAQIIAPTLSLTLPVVDLSTLSEHAREAETQLYAMKEARQPFDLAVGPLMRATMLRLGQEEHALLLTMHHIVSDGWSLGVLIRELVTLYEAFSLGQPSQLPELPIQYADFAQWQRAYLCGNVLEWQLSYWKQKLEGAPTVLELPTDRPRPAIQSFRGTALSFVLTNELTRALKALSRREGVTLFMTLLAAFQVLLHRYTGREDMVIGSPIAGRTRAETEGLIGFFVNTLVLRTDLSGNPTFQELLGRVRKVTLEAYEHQDLPFEKLVEELQPERSLSHTPLVQVMFALQNASVPIVKLPGLTLCPLEVDRGTTKFDLTLIMEEVGDGLVASLEYNTDLFEAATIARLAGHCQQLLAGVVADPDQHVSDLPLLTPQEYQQTVYDWNATSCPYPQEVSLPELFEAQVARTPEVVAVEYEGECLTYHELNQRANQLAHYLQRLGVGPEACVGIYLERSLELIVALLGVLKAGGAYLPLDTSYPAERLSFMLQDAQVNVLLTERTLRDHLPMYGGRLVCLESAAEEIMCESVKNVVSGVDASNLAYVIYTSGSTGRPKGVPVTHHAVNRLVFNTNYIQLGPTDRVAQASNASFDAATFELWGALLLGGRLVIITKDVVLSPHDFVAQMREQRISALFLTTALFNQISKEFPEAFHSVNHVLFGGEAVDPRWVREVLTHCPPERLLHVYGPTESTTFTTWHLVKDVSEDATTVPIGKPISNTQVYVLDRRMHPVPVGVPGELYIGGEGLARGYLNRPELTAEKFIPNPFGNEPGARLYKTGDVARYLADGTIEFLGRIDHQVKIRGFRIELGEIETVLGQHPAVREVVALAREDAPGDRRLVAYLVPHQGQVPSAVGLRCFLQERLPDYMLPTAFVVLEALPLTANGKVDRQALPPQMARPTPDTAYVAPCSPAEQALAEIWSQVLQLDRVGVHDNFFEVGGDSILSIQVAARAQQAGLHLTPKQLFQHQTIAELAAVAGTAPALSQVEQEVEAGPAPLTPIQHWFFEQHLPIPHHFNQAVLLHVHQEMKVAWLEAAVEYLVRHHDALRLRFVRTEAGWQQVIAERQEEQVFSHIDLSWLQADGQALALEGAAAELQTSLNLMRGPLLRVALFELGAQGQRLLIIIHHLAVDGVSWRILLEDLQRSYEQLSRGEAVQLPAKMTSYQQWARQLKAYAQSTALHSERDYWLATSRCRAERLPLDHPAGENTVASARNVEVELDAAETQALLQEVPKAYRTQINEVLLTALLQVMARWTGASNLLVDLEGHGREPLFEGVDLSRTVGWFTTISPVMLELAEATTPAEVLKGVKEQLRSAPNKGIGYGVLRYLTEEAELREQLNGVAQAGISFNYLGQFDQVFGEGTWWDLAREASGPSHSQQGKRQHVLEIDGAITRGQLRLNWTYSELLHRRGTIERLAQHYMEALRVLIAHCQSTEAGGYTPSDFPLAKLDQPTLDRVLGEERQIEEIYPLSPMQQGILFHTLYAPKSGMYCVQLNYSIQGSLNVEAFEQAWRRVVERHAILRTAFVWEGLTTPLQVVYRQVELPLVQHDWRATSSSEQEAQLKAFLQIDRECGFELRKAPLMRLNLCRMTEDTYQLIWSHHHLLLDGWSLPIIFKELFALYKAICQGQDLHLGRSRPYRNYIAWLQQQDMVEAETFWRQTLKGFTTPTPLGGERTYERAAGQEDSYEAQELYLSRGETAALQSLARRHQLTLNTLIQGVWALLLSRYSGEDDVVFGMTVSGRPPNLAGVESMIGLLINTLPMRVQVSPDASIVSWLKGLQAQQVELRRYEYSTLVQVQGWSEIPHGTPLFESILVFENYPADASEQEQDSSLKIHQISSFDRTNYPLTLVAVPGQELLLKLGYDGRRFDAATIRRMMGHLQTLLEGVVADPEQRLSDLPLLTEAERQQLLMEWNSTRADYRRDQCLHQFFETQVEQTPEAVAVVFEDEQLTYRQLNRRANQLARHLQALEVGPEVLVGICVERSVEMVVGILGILKAGGAYMPLDPAYPRERLAFMLEDARVPVLVTQERLLKELPEHGARVVCLDDGGQTIARESEENPASGARAENLAYMIYTSGSTGKPKGVMNTHRGLCNRLHWMQQAYQLTTEDRIMQKTPFSFDVSVWEFFWPLITGACLVVARPGGHQNPDYLVSLIEAQQITTLHFVPSMLQVFLMAPGLERCKSLKRVICSGEALPFELQERFFSHLDAELHNLYGPTEAAIDVTYWQCQRESRERVVPIGYPIANTQIYILDRSMHPVPVGVAGELYIGGAGVARGYFNRPELTAEKFVPDPFSKEAGARLYKTGDWARYLPDGNIEYLERLDHQVKIRGFRIELGEVEVVLGQHPAVREAVVLAREDVAGDKRLVAYVVPNPEQVPTVSDLRGFVKAKLPEYMVPAAFVLLEALPLTPIGKVDRRALPVPERAQPELEAAFVAPRDIFEFRLAQVWEDVLDICPIGVTDNFYDLGGHSLLAIRLMTQVQQQFGQNISLATLLQNATIEQMARVLRQQTAFLSWSPLVAIQPKGSKRPFFCVHPGPGSIFCYLDLARHLGPDQPFYGLQARGLDGELEPFTNIENMAATYIEAMRIVQSEGPYRLGGHSFGGLVAFEMAQQLERQGHQVALLAILDTAPPPSGRSMNSDLVENDVDDARWLADIAGIVERFWGKNMSVSYDELRQLEPNEQFSYILERLWAVNLLPEDAGVSLVRGLLRVQKANVRSYHKYVPRVYPNQITLFRASEVRAEDYNETISHYLEDSSFGWDKYSSGPTQVYIVPGDHVTMLADPHVETLAEQLESCL